MRESRPASAVAVRLAYLAAVGLFLWAVARFYDHSTGFSSLISIGDAITPKVDALERVPHYVYEKSAGYDGAYYVQLALNPTLRNPELKEAIDNPWYRARRILFSWAAWLLGFGQPAWIVQVYSLLNVISWLVLAAVLLRWFPPTDMENFFRWFGVMFSHGLCMSVRDSLVDGPSLLLIALMMRAIEDNRRGRAGVILSLAGLGKETSLLALCALAPGDRPGDVRRSRPWLHWIVGGSLISAPLLVWIGYVRWRFGPVEDAGLGNFTLPLAGYAEKWGGSVADFIAHPYSPQYRDPLLAMISLTAQAAFLAARWRPASAWWRMGIGFVGLMVILSTPVWEGYPGAFTRVLLPLTLAFNLLVPRGRAWYALLIAGNLSAVVGLHEAVPPPHDFVSIIGWSRSAAQLRVEPGAGWYSLENGGATHWCWSRGDATIELHNAGPAPVHVICHGVAKSASDTRTLQIAVGPKKLWSATLSEAPEDFRFETTCPPGETSLEFTTDQPAHPVGRDFRRIAFRISNLEIVVPAQSGQP